MSSKTIDVTLDPGNLIWLEAKAIASGRRTVSEVLNEIIAGARTGNHRGVPEVKSVVGQASISDADPSLQSGPLRSSHLRRGQEP